MDGWGDLATDKCRGERIRGEMKNGQTDKISDGWKEGKRDEEVW